MKSKIKRREKIWNLPRRVVILASSLGFRFQPNRGSSFYIRTPKGIIPEDQKDWNCPVGSLRLSDHWNYENKNEEVVYRTDQDIPGGAWVLCLNTLEHPTPWKVLAVFNQTKKGLFQIDHQLIRKQISLLRA